MTLYPAYEDPSLFKTAAAMKGRFPVFISLNEIRSYPLHHHDFAELSLVIDGSGVETINGTPHTIRPGTASLLLPHHIHKYESSSQLRLYCCMFDMHFLFSSPHDAELAGSLLRVGRELPSHAVLSELQAEKASMLAAELLQEYLGDTPFKISPIRAKLIELLTIYMRSAIVPGQTAAPIAPLESKRSIGDIVRYMHLHYSERLTLDDLAVRFHFSPPYISRLFKEKMDCTFLDYLHDLRIQSAASLLATTDMTVSEIATEVGFDSFRTFSRVFKELKGMTPTAFRELHGSLKTR